MLSTVDSGPAIRLQTVDWLVIGSYFVLILLISLYYRRFAGRSVEDFFLSGRRNSGWANGVSYAAALMNADVAPAYSGIVVATGLFACWFYLSRFGLALFVGAMLFAVFWRRLKLFTTPEFYELRFGGLASNVIRTWVALRSSLIAMVAWTGTGLLAIHKISEPVLGASKTQAIALVVPIVLVYVAVAGLSGVVVTASVQSLIMVVGSAMLCGIVLYSIGGPVVLAERLAAVAGDPALNVLPPSDHWFFPAAAAVALTLGTSIGYGGDTAPLGGAMEGQLIQSSRSAREASRMYLAAEITLFILLLLVTLPSLGAVVEWPWLRSEGVDRERAYGLLMARYMPPGMLGLLFVVMLAAVMSTIASNLIFGAQLLVGDVYRRFLRPSESDAHYLWIGRAAALLILVLAIIVAFRATLIFHVAVFMLTASAAELPANWAQWWWWRFNRWARLSASFGAMLLLGLVWFVLPTRTWNWWNQMYAVVAANTLLWVVVTLLTPADDPKILEQFYRKGRPLGLWTPVRRRLGETGRPTADGGLLIIVGLGLAVLGAASVALLVQGLSLLYVGQYAIGGWHLLAALAGGAAFLKGYGPFLDRLEQWGGTEDSLQTPQAVREADVVSDLPSDDHLPQPVSTSLVVSVTTAAYGLIILAVAMVSDKPADRLFNLIAGAAFIASAGAVLWLGRRPTPSSNTHETRSRSAT